MTANEYEAQDVRAPSAGECDDDPQDRFSSLASEIRVAQERLARQTLMLEQAERVAHVGSWRFALDTDDLVLSDEMYRIFDLDPHTFDGDFNAITARATCVGDRERIEAANAAVIADGVPRPIEYRILAGDGSVRWIRAEGRREVDGAGDVVALAGFAQDITGPRRAEEALRTRLVALTQPSVAVAGVEFVDLFELQDIQRIQDSFAAATGVGSIITKPDGTPITRPSNFCRFCSEVVRRTEKGLANCIKSDAVVGDNCETGARIQACLSGGLVDAGARITVGGEHVANWLIGQVKQDGYDEDRMLAYADEIGADREDFRAALAEVPVMPAEQFERVAQALFSFANELSLVAYQNVQQARLITEQTRAEAEVRRLNEDLEVRDHERTGMLRLLDELAEQRGRHLETLKQTLTSVIDVVGQIVETRDPYTAGHQRRVAELAVRIATDMGLRDEAVSDIRTAALIHDVGKISIPAEILSKPGPLSIPEAGLIQGHAEAGYRIISSAHMKGQTAELVYQHHERCDGSGYPRGLIGAELLVGAKVLMVADVVEAMASHRPYRPTLGIDAALVEVEEGAGVRFEESVVRSCTRIFREQGFTFSEFEKIL